MLLKILSAISALKQIIGWGIEAFKLISHAIFRRKLESKEKKTKVAEEKLTEANLIEEDQRRLAEKAKAARELEDSIRPH